MNRLLFVALVAWTLHLPESLAQDSSAAMLALGDAERGRLVFAPCRTCHSALAGEGHHNGPNLNAIFGKVAGKQRGFDYYSDTFREAKFVWTPQLMYAWLEAPMKMFPGTTMISQGIPDARARADLVAYLLRVTARN